MNDSIYNEQGDKVAAAHPVKKEKAKGTKPSERRSEIKSAERSILEYGRKSPRFQLEAICVLADIADAKGDLTKIPPYDIQIVQWYLNYGYFKEDGIDRTKFTRHRMQRAQELMRTLPRFLKKDDCTIANIALLTLLNDNAEIDKKLQHLPNKPVGNVAAMSNTNISQTASQDGSDNATFSKS